MGRVGLPKWKKDATEFTVNVGYHADRGYQVYIPRPVIETLKVHPDKTNDPRPVTFVIKGKRVEIRATMD